MKKTFFLFVIMVALYSCKATKESANSKKKIDEKVLIGVIDRNVLEQDVLYREWFHKNYLNTAVDKETIVALKKYLKGVTIKAFIGVWCKDSQREMPVLYKVLDEINFDTENNLKLVAVDKKKKANGLEKGFNVIMVPTFIFYKDGVELGRFIEYAKENTEEVMLKILSGKQYKHPYDFD